MTLEMAAVASAMLFGFIAGYALCYWLFDCRLL